MQIHETLVAAALLLAGCATPPADSEIDVEPVASTRQAAATLPSPVDVRVINPDSNPVKTASVGTTQVAGITRASL